MHRKAGAGDAIGKGRWSGGRPLDKSAYFLVESPVKKAFLSRFQADLSCTPQISFAEKTTSFVFLLKSSIILYTNSW
jgi:hypothetical protein